MNELITLLYLMLIINIFGFINNIINLRKIKTFNL